MTLLDRLKEQSDRDAAEHCPAEIIALQREAIAEIERLEPLQYRQAPCHKFCEATAFEITIRALTAERDALKSQLDDYTVMMTARCDALASKVKVLREALEGAVESTHAWGYFDVAKARAALEATK